MIQLVLDAGPLQYLCMMRDPFGWGATVGRAHLLGWDVWIPEISDFEFRRYALLKITAGQMKRQVLANLDSYCERLRFHAIDTETMRHAAQIWADARRNGFESEHPKALAGDTILAAQVRMIAAESIDNEVLLATTNPKHMSRYVRVVSVDELTAMLAHGG